MYYSTSTDFEYYDFFQVPKFVLSGDPLYQGNTQVTTKANRNPVGSLEHFYSYSAFFSFEIRGSYLQIMNHLKDRYVQFVKSSYLLFFILCMVLGQPAEKVAIIHHIITQPYCFDFLLTEP